MEELSKIRIMNLENQVNISLFEQHADWPVSAVGPRLSERKNSESPLISVLLPTRQRPDVLLKMLESLFGMADRPERLEAVVYIDDDDALTQKLKFDAWNVKRLVGPRQTMGRFNAICYAHSTGDIIILGNDDMIVRTRGWDTCVRDAAGRFTDKVYLLYPNDLCKGSKICTFPILSRVTCDTIGDPFPADYRGAFIDVHVMDIFKRLYGFGHQRIAYLDDVIFEHMHYRVGKSEYDATYRERDRFGDDQTFLVLNNARGWAVQRLKAVIDGTGSTSQERLIVSRPVGGWFLQLTWNILYSGSAPLPWRIRLFFWMWLRFVYRNIKKLFA
jgi:glycosyltransferase involved in cell wall biosynthesis